MRFQRFEDAISSFDKVIKLKPDFVEVHNEIGEKKKNIK